MRFKIALCLCVLLVGPKTTLFGESFDEIFRIGAKLHYQCMVIETKDHNQLDKWDNMYLWYFMGYVSGQDELFTSAFPMTYPGFAKWSNGDVWDIVAIYSVNHPEITEADKLFEGAIVEKDPKFREIITKSWVFNMPKK
jgi:hypothetical protein